VVGGLGPVPPQRHVDRVAVAAVGADSHLAEFPLAVCRRRRTRLADRQDRPPNVHAAVRRRRRKTLSVTHTAALVGPERRLDTDTLIRAHL